MNNNNQLTLKEAIDQMLKAYQLKARMAEQQVISSWPATMGTMIAKHTTKLYISNRQLFVSLDSAALRQELSYSKEKIIKNLNEAAGANVIDTIHFQ